MRWTPFDARCRLDPLSPVPLSSGWLRHGYTPSHVDDGIDVALIVGAPRTQAVGQVVEGDDGVGLHDDDAASTTQDMMVLAQLVYELGVEGGVAGGALFVGDRKQAAHTQMGGSRRCAAGWCGCGSGSEMEGA